MPKISRNRRSIKNKKGGSKASDLVMETSNPKLCDSEVSPVIEGPRLDYDMSNLSLYRTTGGGGNHNHGHGHVHEPKQRGGNGCSGRRVEPKQVGAGCCSKCTTCGVGVGGGRNNNHAGINPNCRINSKGGGSSDWRTTVYSRGPVNTPDMDPDQFRMFTQTGEFMSNQDLRTASFLRGGRKKSRRTNSKSKKNKSKNLRLKKSKINKKPKKSKVNKGGSRKYRKINKMRSDRR